MSINALPTELLHLIAKMLGEQRDINALTRTTRHLYSHLSPLLYSNNVKYDNASALWFSVIKNLPRTARQLIEAGANPEIRDIGGWTPLSMAALRGHVEVAKVLIECGAYMKVKSEKQENAWQSPIHLAAFCGQDKMLELLLEKGVGPDLVNELNNFSAPLHYAAESSCVSTVKLLIKKGAQINIKRRYSDDTPLSLALSFAPPYDTVFERNRISETALSLIDMGADIEAKHEKRGTPLFQAAVGNHENVVRRLLEKNVNTEALFFDGKADNPLQAAISRGCTDVVPLLESVVNSKQEKQGARISEKLKV
ncbi:uncharacterized protein PFLUO_LOCUS4617 [Penicillium psychrofluorescens]|uniref:uncharacterized protein n=1 Tax=Penicillium psychrofluorescens TaxID=3158075 RepID=UPI003CCE1B18